MRNSFIVSHHFKKIKEKMYFYVEIDLKKKKLYKNMRGLKKRVYDQKNVCGFYCMVFILKSLGRPQSAIHSNCCSCLILKISFISSICELSRELRPP